MNGPIRIRRQRTGGWRMPAGAVYVGRPGKWGNPWRAGDGTMSAGEAVEKYRAWVVGQIRAGVLDLDELVGHDLACWCGLDRPCHVDVLIDLVGAYVRRLGQRVPGGPNP